MLLVKGHWQGTKTGLFVRLRSRRTASRRSHCALASLHIAWLLCLVSLGSLWLAPPGLAANDRVVYVDNLTLWTANSLGGNREQVTESGGENRVNTDDLSPDGSTAVVQGGFHGVGGLSLVNLATHVRTQLYSGESARPRFSPDGKKVIFDTYSILSNEAHIKMINTDGTGLTSIITWKGIQEDPDFSPD